jgi:lipopolysaccharide export system permease protein
MRWPWNKRNRREEALKRQLVASAYQQLPPPDAVCGAVTPPTAEQPATATPPIAAGMPARSVPPGLVSSPDSQPAFAATFLAVDDRAELGPREAPRTAATAFPTAPFPAQPVPLPSPRREPAKKNGNGNGNSSVFGVAGTDLTLYFARRSTRAIGLKGRPRPRRTSQQRAATHIGRDLTRHTSRRGKRVNLISPEVQRLSFGQTLWSTIVYLLRWLFIIRPKILIIERYIWAECWGNFLLGSLGFTFFMIITTIFALGEKIFQKNIPPFTIVKVLLLSAPAFLVLAIPVAVVFSSLMAMNRLNRDNELTAFNTTGISLYRIIVPFLSLGIFAGLLTWVIYEHVVPPNNQEYKDVLKVFWEAQVVDFIKPGIVIKAPDKKYFYVEEIQKEMSENEFGAYQRSVMVDVRLYDYNSDKAGGRQIPRIFVAKRAWVEGDFLVLSDVRLYNLDEERGNTLVSASMPQIKIDIGTRTREYTIEPHPSELTAMQLRARIQLLRDRIDAMPFRNPEEIAKYLNNQTEYYFKYAIPMACVAFALICVPVMIRGPRDERNLGLIMTFVVCMSYYIIFFSCRTLGGRGVFLSKDLVLFGTKLIATGDNLFPPLIAGWFAPAVFFAAAGVLLWRVRK